MDTVNITTSISDRTKNFANYSRMIGLLNDSKSGAVSTNGKTLVYPFKWKNQWVTAIGVEFKPTNTVTLRGGFNYAKNPMRDEYLMANMPSMALVETHVSVGASYISLHRIQSSLLAMSMPSARQKTTAIQRLSQC